MINRVTIFAASLAAALALAGGLALAGLAPGTGAADAEPVSDPVVAVTDAPAPIVQTDIVYVAPRVAPQDVVVTRVVTAARAGDDEGETEGSDD
jgi:hypothetical protein